ncbi:MAG: D-2-hydroxyacid dehydrogenase [Ruminococcaceae bacterium]|nr:D-2-hydroxyacid dehydrogenase [Oscillospiraceae bacterium]
MKILLTDVATVVSNNDLSLDIFTNFGETVEYANITHEELLEAVSDVDIILCNKTVINREIMNAAKNLKYIGTFATGYNNIDIDAAREKGITVLNAAEYSTNAVAQQVIAYILLHYTKISNYDAFVKEGGWKKSLLFSPLVFATDEVFGKTLGIVGYGSIGKAVEKAALGLGMKVLVYTRTPKPNGVTEFVSFEELLSRSDVLTLHCPLNEQSANLMNCETFAKMKDGAFFINTARGGVVVEAHLLEALQSGKLSGAAIDVLTKEPMSEECFLQNVPNLIITPHTAWAPLTTRKRLVDLVANNLRAFLNGEEVNNLAK